MSRKKGLSFDEKRNRLLNIFYERKEMFNLKELEKLGGKAGIVTQTVKEVLQSLVDDGIVDFEKIGAQNFYWAFPSKAVIKRENKIKALDESLATAKAKRDELKAKVADLTEGRETTDERSATLAAHAEAADRLKKLKEELQVQRENDPETLRELETTAGQCRDAANRWTDNTWLLKSFVMKKMGRSSREVDTALGLPSGFDYVE